MAAKPTYDELERRIKELEEQLSYCAKNEQTMKGEQERFRLLYERAPLAYQSLDEQGRLIEVNQAWLAILGYERHEVIGRSVSEFLSPEWRDHFKQNFPRFKSVGEVMGVEFEMRTKSGDPLLVSVNGKIGYDRNGNFMQTHCILYDITERNRADMIRDQIVVQMQEKLEKENEIASMSTTCSSCKKKIVE
jgi:PAS domain S-box-containing protein